MSGEVMHEYELRIPKNAALVYPPQHASFRYISVKRTIEEVASIIIRV